MIVVFRLLSFSAFCTSLFNISFTCNQDNDYYVGITNPISIYIPKISEPSIHTE